MPQIEFRDGAGEQGGQVRLAIGGLIKGCGRGTAIRKRRLEMCFRLGKIPVVLPFDPCQPIHRPAGQAWIQTGRYFMQIARPAHDPPDEHDGCIGMDAQGEGWVNPALSIVGRELIPA